VYTKITKRFVGVPVYKLNVDLFSSNRL